MPKLPVVSGVDVVKALAEIGWELDHQTGSHVILRQRDSPHRRLTVQGREAGLTVEEFLTLL